MIRSLWNRLFSQRDSGIRQTSRRRSRPKLNAGCETLDGRQLLSTLPVVSLSSVPTPAVANAASRLESVAPVPFSQFESALAQAESRSHVTQSQVNKLLQDESALDQAIQSAGLDANTASGDIGHVMDEVDGAFVETTTQVASKVVPLDQYLSNVPGAPKFVRRTIEQMQVIARAARLTPRLHAIVDTDEASLSQDLGPTPDTNLGPGATDRDPLYVYYNAQVGNFVE
jgi:hypothetical protein